LINRNGKVMYSGVVRDEATQSAIVNALGATFGEANIVGSLRVDRNVKRAAWLPHLGDLFATLKTQAWSSHSTATPSASEDGCPQAIARHSPSPCAP
jgi:hypothetical protein